jgi:molybdopterin synthase catalytic subunit
MKLLFFHPLLEVEGLMQKLEITVEIHSQPFDPWIRLSEWSSTAAASASFSGRVRDVAENGSSLEALELTHYPGLCESLIREDAERLLTVHGATAALVIHRVGRLSPHEVIVLVAVEADRRGPAQRCCMALLEAIKHQAPFWKKEWRNGQGSWVSGNTPL